MLESTRDFDAGLQLVDKSLAAKEHWYNLWTKAQLLAAKGKYKEAMTYAQKAKQLGDKTPQAFLMADDGNKALKDWKDNKSGTRGGWKPASARSCPPEPLLSAYL